MRPEMTDERTRCRRRQSGAGLREAQLSCVDIAGPFPGPRLRSSSLYIQSVVDEAEIWHRA